MAADAGGLPPEAMEPLTIVDLGPLHKGLQALHSWLEPICPYLLLLPLVMWVWVSGPERLRSLWGQMLEHPLGGFWPVAAALIPPFIARASAKGYSGWTAGLLLAIAIIQIYGQQRSERYRKSGDAQVRRISAGVDRISAGVDRIGIDIGRLAAYLTAEEEAEEQEETRS